MTLWAWHCEVLSTQGSIQKSTSAPAGDELQWFAGGEPECSVFVWLKHLHFVVDPLFILEGRINLFSLKYIRAREFLFPLKTQRSEVTPEFLPSLSA